MDYTHRWESPLGRITLGSDGERLIGLWFEGQAHFGAGLHAAHVEKSLPVFDEAERWLECFFQGRDPGFTPPVSPRGTDFQQRVWNALLEIPFGRTLTYGDIAARLHTSARAVGNAIARNPIALIIPCHRVMGAGGRLTGYAGGLERKVRLLALERGEQAGREWERHS